MQKLILSPANRESPKRGQTALPQRAHSSSIVATLPEGLFHKRSDLLSSQGKIFTIKAFDIDKVDKDSFLDSGSLFPCHLHPAFPISGAKIAIKSQCTLCPVWLRTCVFSPSPLCFLLNHFPAQATSKSRFFTFYSPLTFLLCSLALQTASRRTKTHPRPACCSSHTCLNSSRLERELVCFCCVTSLLHPRLHSCCVPRCTALAVVLGFCVVLCCHRLCVRFLMSSKLLFVG